MNGEMRTELQARVDQARREALGKPAYADRSERQKLEDKYAAKFKPLIPAESPIRPADQARMVARMLVNEWFRHEEIPA